MWGWFLSSFYCVIGEVISEAYDLEYGTDCLEMQIDAVKPGERALVIDDLVATGGTLSAAIRLLGMLCRFAYLVLWFLFLFLELFHKNTIL